MYINEIDVETGHKLYLKNILPDLCNVLPMEHRLFLVYSLKKSITEGVTNYLPLP